MSGWSRKVRRAIYENVNDGKIEIVGVNEDGEHILRLTDEGKARAEAVIDRYIDAGYADPVSALAQALNVPEQIAADVIDQRLKERGDAVL